MRINIFKADITLNLPKVSLNKMLLKQIILDKEISDGKAQITGDKAKFQELAGLTDITPAFDIVTP